MTHKLTIAFEADDNYKNDDAAVLVVFDDDQLTMLSGFTGKTAVELYEKLIAGSNAVE